MLKVHLHPSLRDPSVKFVAKTLPAGGCPRSSVLLFSPAAPAGGRRGRRGGGVRSTSAPTVAVPAVEKGTAIFTVTADVTVKLAAGSCLSRLGLSGAVDAVADFFRKTLLLELVSDRLDPKTGEEKEMIQGYARRASEKDGFVTYVAEFEISRDFGNLGAVLVTNEQQKEMYLQSITFRGFPLGPVDITCNSWVHSTSDNSEKRVFFANKSYLPSETPSGLKRLREEELKALRGDGQGERKSSDRIYDYDTYNDLGDPDSNPDLRRPVLGGEDFPYPRRCRTGRPPTRADPLSETRSGNVYVPRDEVFSDVKQATFLGSAVDSALQAAVPSIETLVGDMKMGFSSFTDIDSLFTDGFALPKQKVEGISGLLSRLVNAIARTVDSILHFDIPELVDLDKFSWLKDEEFARQTLAGVNPMSIQLVTEFPLKSKLDPEVYGPAESAITKDIIEREISGVMTLEEALEQKRLFVIDYHDLLLPYVHKVRALEGTTLYGSRTLFFLAERSTLTPIAIELTRPKSDNQPHWRRVFTRGHHATDRWLWKFAKSHVLAHDSAYHEVVVHWLRTHCAVEPFIIATNRQLSAMHPIYRLLHPHCRFTMRINALARQALINAQGIIEISFSSKKYSMELSAVAYDKLWRFDQQSLPGDLISRGMALEDPAAEHGLKLAIEDYPFANDGLLVWSSIKEWVTDYVNRYYPDPAVVSSDSELQSWWTEVKTKAHPDKKEGWPPLESPANLVEILTTIIWIASCHHAAVNFGQYGYGGYFPNRPTISRIKIPSEARDEGDDAAFQRFVEKPEQALLESFPTPLQATIVMAVLQILSNHSPDEEYLGGEAEAAWKEDPEIAAAFERFNCRMREVEGIVDERNANANLRNRSGAGLVPYRLLKPFSGPGVTGQGVPNSTSI